MQKKCFVASACLHGLLGVVVLVTAAFRSEPTVAGEQVLTLISPLILDRAGSGGEAPAVIVPRPPAPPPAPAPSPTRPATPSPAPPRVTPPPMPTTIPAPRQTARSTTPDKPASAPAARGHIVVPTFDPAPRSATAGRQSGPSPTAGRSASDNRAQELSTALASLASGVRTAAATATVVTVPGEGGGEAFVGYDTLVYNVYYHAWNAPQETSDTRSADAKIVVTRDGTIVSHEITRRSGNPAIDSSVERVLDQVKQLPPFPEASHDAQRTFIISFSLEATQAPG
ncbi:MAG: energy transducer TonB [Verrucomicrobiota bacterium]